MNALSPQSPQPAQVRRMFDQLSARYDRFNQLASFGLDRSWRSRLIRDAAQSGLDNRTLLDCGTGTGDLILDFFKAGHKPKKAHFIGIDFSGPMLHEADVKMAGQSGVSLINGSVAAIPLDAGTADIVMSAFVLRNIKKVMSEFLAELHRVMRPGGRFYFLELAQPENFIMRWGHSIYLNTILPLIGKSVFGKNWVGDYLAQTIFHFWSRTEYKEMLAKAGFKDVRAVPLSGGIAVLYSGIK